MSLVDGQPHSASCYVRENAVLLEMDRAEFGRLLGGSNIHLGRLAAEGRVPLSRVGAKTTAPNGA